MTLSFPQLLLIAAAINLLLALITGLRAGRSRGGLWAVALGLALAVSNLLLAELLRERSQVLLPWWLIFAGLPGLIIPLTIALANVALLRRGLLALNALAWFAALAFAGLLAGDLTMAPSPLGALPQVPAPARFLALWAGLAGALALLDMVWLGWRSNKPQQRQRLALTASAVGLLLLGLSIDWLAWRGIGLGPWGFAAALSAQLLLAVQLWLYKGPRRIAGTVAPALLAASRQAVLICDGEGRVQAANPAAIRLMDRKAYQVLGAELDSLLGLSTDHLDTASRLHGAGYVERVRLDRAGKDEAQRELVIQPMVLRADDGEVLAVILSLGDGSDDPSLSVTSLHDPVSGLAGAALGEALLAQELRRHAGGSGPLVAAIFVRLDDAGGIAARHGQLVYEKLQAAVAERLGQVCDWPVDLARTDGGGFLLLLSQVTDHAEVSAICERLHEMVNSSYTVAAETLTPPVLSVLIPDLRLYHDLLDLLGDVRHALAQARREPARSFRCDAPAKERINIALALETAIANDALDLRLEPVMDLLRERPLGARVLMQWEVEGRPLIADAELRRLARRVHLEGPLNQWRLRRIAALTAPAGFALWLPVATEELQQANFQRSLLTKASRGSHKLLLELPDLCWQLPALRKIAGDLVAAGMALHASEFSVGARVLTHAAGADPKAASLDARLVQIHGPATDQMLKGLVATARAMKLALRAEGVRKRADLKRLREAGVALASGDYFGPALAPETLAAWLNDEARHAELFVGTATLPDPTVKPRRREGVRG